MKTQFFLADGITDAFDSFHDLIMGSNADTGNVIAKLVQKTDEILDYPGGQYIFLAAGIENLRDTFQCAVQAGFFWQSQNIGGQILIGNSWDRGGCIKTGSVGETEHMIEV